MPDWLKDAVFYEIYPQSFYDSNGDGIGDVNGIREKLGYVKSLGCNAIWLNPLFDSPFKDAGYDVRNYKLVAPRYGTNGDLRALFADAHEMGIRVLLDLVPGHTSEEHPWFLSSAQAERNEYSDRYIWTDWWLRGVPGYPYIGGETPRNGTYMLNFFKCQPALNYGWGRVTEPWQFACDSASAIETREAMKDVMRFWLDMGCDGFRVDMANSLVKDDDAEKSHTCAIWRNVREMLDNEYPDCAMVSEWSAPRQALSSARFHMDFYLDHWGNGYNSLLRDEGRSYFKAGDKSDITRFTREYMDNYLATRADGYISLITGNHDTPRLARTLSPRELKLAYATLLTLPGVPFLYYGDEIGMRYLDRLPSKEGGYDRTGSRTPMQWTGGKNLGFSAADSDKLYLPVDPSEDAPCVEAQEKDADSLLNTVRRLLSLRHERAELQADGELSIVHAVSGDALFAYRRGDTLLAVNPSLERVSMELLGCEREISFVIGSAQLSDGRLSLGPQSFAML